MLKSVTRVISLLLAIVLCLALTGCKAADEAAAKKTEAPAATAAPAATQAQTTQAPATTDPAFQPKVIGFAQSRMSHPYRVAAVEQFKNAIAEKGLPWEVIVTDGNNDTAKQTADVEDLISKKVDAIVMSPITADPLVPACQSVMKSGIPLILANRTITTKDYTAFVGGRNYDGGVLVAEAIAKEFNGKAKVALIEGTLGSSDVLDRTAGFLETLKKYPEIEVVAQVSGDYQQDEGMKCMEDILTKNKVLDAVWCENDTMAFGAVTAAESMGRTVKVYGMDGQLDAYRMIDEGRLAGTVLYPTGSALAVDVLVEIFNNNGVYTGPKEIQDPLILVTKENIEENRHLAF